MWLAKLNVRLVSLTFATALHLDSISLSKCLFRINLRVAFHFQKKKSLGAGILRIKGSKRRVVGVTPRFLCEQSFKFPSFLCETPILKFTTPTFLCRYWF